MRADLLPSALMELRRRGHGDAVLIHRLVQALESKRQRIEGGEHRMSRRQIDAAIRRCGLEPRVVDGAIAYSFPGYPGASGVAFEADFCPREKDPRPADTLAGGGRERKPERNEG